MLLSQVDHFNECKVERFKMDFTRNSWSIWPSRQTQNVSKSKEALSKALVTYHEEIDVGSVGGKENDGNVRVFAQLPEG